MRRALINRFDKRRLRAVLTLFFLALAVPTAILIYRSYDQLKWEAFHQHRVMAEELAGRIDARAIELIAAEEARSFADYSFLVATGSAEANFVQHSPLSAYPVASEVPGLIGYFQVDAAGTFSSPLVPPPGSEPKSFGITEEEYAARLSLEHQIRDVLSHNRLIRAHPVSGVASNAPTRPSPARMDSLEPFLDKDASAKRALEEAALEEADEEVAQKQEVGAEITAEVPEQRAFDALSMNESNDNLPRAPEPAAKTQRTNTLGKLEDLKLDSAYEGKSVEHEERQSGPAAVAQSYRREKRTEQGVVPQAQIKGGETAAGGKAEVGITTFESEIDPFEFSMLDSGQFVLFRKVWRDGQRYIQGALIDQRAFIDGIVGAAFGTTALSHMSDLIVAYRDEVLNAFSGDPERDYLGTSDELRGALLYRTDLSAPLGELKLVFSITRLPVGPGGALLVWISVILAAVLCGGFYLLYRLGVGQLDLAAQQQDFVSAVSHELKTPLTSIRMYGEMLKQGWADEAKKREYYDYIHDESERLSRLITNVLQLARMSRNDLQLELKRVRVGELMDQVRSKIATQVERAGFALALDCDDETRDVMVSTDADSFTQIVINLVDNAIKFSARAGQKRIEIGARLQSDGTVMFSVRDFGSGVSRDQMKKIFRLFYRSENELTRETVGTGIGLALVHQLADAMHGRVDVVNRDPGAEFRVSLPVRA